MPSASVTAWGATRGQKSPRTTLTSSVAKSRKGVLDADGRSAEGPSSSPEVQPATAVVSTSVTAATARRRTTDTRRT
ncbi:hypothetical protein GCM10009795_038970 [Nocardioides hankookensis]